MEKINLLLVDDSELVLDSLSLMFKEEKGIDIIGKAKNGKEAVKFVKKRKPDIVLMDLQMPEMNGLEAAREIRRVDPEIRVVMLTIHEEDKYLSQAAECGIYKYLVKTAPAIDIIDTIKSAYYGKVIIKEKKEKDYFFEDRKAEKKFELLKDQQQRILELSSLVQTGKKISSLRTINEIGEALRDILPSFFECKYFLFCIKERVGYRVISSAGFSKEFILFFEDVLSKEIENIAAEEVIAVTDTEKNKDLNGKHIFQEFGLKSLLVSPLFLEDGLKALIIIATECYSEFSANLKDVMETICSQTKVAIDNINLYGELEDVFIQTISSLSMAIEAKDKYTKGHSEEVVHYSLRLADSIELPPKKKETLRIAGLLHDVGKIGIADNILTKRGPLTKTERTLLETHPVIGANIVKSVKLLKPVVNIILSHHERYDGTGYPNGLRGERICIEARILSIADAFDAMTSQRAYRGALSKKSALLQIENGAGSQFDPSLAKKFVSLHS